MQSLTEMEDTEEAPPLEKSELASDDIESVLILIILVGESF